MRIWYLHTHMIPCRTWGNKIWDSQIHLLLPQMNRGATEIGTEMTVKLFLSTFLGSTFFYNLGWTETVETVYNWECDWDETKMRWKHFFFPCFSGGRFTFLSSLPLVLAVPTKTLGHYTAKTPWGPLLLHHEALVGCDVLVHKQSPLSVIRAFQYLTIHSFIFFNRYLLGTCISRHWSSGWEWSRK